MKAEPLVVEKTYNAKANRIWKAITDPQQMKEWYFDLGSFKPQVGFEFQFYGGSPEKQYLHLCKITEVDPGKKLTYSWRYDGYPGESFLTFELFDEGDKTRLKLTHKGLETFPAEKDFARSSFEKGWNSILNESLKNYLEKTTVTH
jgi:uncharacterized protein YndB with AHSA1/START domain